MNHDRNNDRKSMGNSAGNSDRKSMGNSAGISDRKDAGNSAGNHDRNSDRKSMRNNAGNHDGNSARNNDMESIENSARNYVRKNRAGNICMVLGTVLVLAALFLFLWNLWEDRQAGDLAEDILPRIKAKVEKTGDAGDTGDAEEDRFYPDPYDPAMTVVEIDGYGYVGYLFIPALELELPVMAEWDYTRLKIAPCRYAGSTKTDNLVIAAHNYSRHFGRLSSLSQGDRVIFTDMDGAVWTYEVAAIEVLSPGAVEDMTDSGYDLTLFTCTYGGASRVTVRCERVK